MTTDKERLQCERLCNAAEKIVDELDVMLRAVRLHDICYAHKIRAKTSERLAEKIENRRTQAGKPSYDPFSATDLVGLRILTLYRSDLLKIVPIILGLIRHESLSAEYNKFRKGSLEEAIIYSPKKSLDPIGKGVIQLIDSTGECKTTPTISEKAPGYSSVHLVARLNWRKITDAPSNYSLPIEIQIRTVFEDAWGEIDHKCSYQSRRRGDSTEDYPTTKHLGVLKQFVDACVGYADLIGEQFQLQDSEVSPTSVELVERKEDEIRRLFSKRGVSDKLSVEYLDIRSFRDSAFAIEIDDPSIARLQLIEAAERFESLYDSATTDSRTGSLKDEALRVIQYFSLMGKALCWLRLENRTAARDAAEIYQRIDGEYPGNALVCHRLGQAWSQFGSHLLAVHWLKKSVELVELYRATDEVPEMLTESDLRHLLDSTYRVLGYEYWRLARDLSPESGDYAKHYPAHLKHAFDVSRKGLQADISADASLSLMHNMVFYATDFHAYADKAGLSPTARARYISKKSLTNTLAKLRRAVDVEKCGDAYLLDSMLYAYNYLGESDAAKQLANRLQHLQNSNPSVGLTQEMIDRVESTLGQSGN